MITALLKKNAPKAIITPTPSLVYFKDIMPLERGGSQHYTQAFSRVSL